MGGVPGWEPSIGAWAAINRERGVVMLPFWVSTARAATVTNTEQKMLLNHFGLGGTKTQPEGCLADSFGPQET